MGTLLTAACFVGIVAVVIDNVTGVSVADDFLFVPLGAGISKGLIMIF